MRISIQVNHRLYEVDIDDADTPLLYVLRDYLGLKGTRFGCGTGDCGACMVLVDGHARKSCELALGSVVEQPITTIEGLGRPDQLHPLQQAMIELQAGQCGYCLSGIIMTAAELLATNAEPSRQRIVEALSRAPNLCRCGAQVRIVKAIETAWKNVAHGAVR
jgi:aerobic-type carbon monoxide dehydrogenase small subunit (CoxS/CutS family)